MRIPLAFLVVGAVAVATAAITLHAGSEAGQLVPMLVLAIVGAVTGAAASILSTAHAVALRRENAGIGHCVLIALAGVVVLLAALWPGAVAIFGLALVAAVRGF